MKVRGQYSGLQKNGEFAGLLKACEMSQAELARRIGVHPPAVFAWATGKIKVPGAVLAYLRLYRDVRAIAV